MDNKKIILIEGKAGVSEKLLPLLEEQNCQVFVSREGLSGIQDVYQHKPDLIFLDSSIEDISAFQVCTFLKDKDDFKEIPIVLLGIDKAEELNLFRIKEGILDFIDVSQDLDWISQQIKAILDKHQESLFASKSFKLIEELTESIRCLSGGGQAENREEGALAVLCEEIVYKVTSILGSEVGSLMMMDKAGEHLFIKAARGLDEDIINNTRIKLGEKVSGWVVKRGRPVLVTDIEKDSRFPKASSGRYYTNSLLSAPLNLGRLKGVININNKTTKEPYNEEDLALLTALIRHLNSTAENASLFKELADRNEKLEKLKSDKKILSGINKLLDKELYDIRISYEINKILNSELDYKQTISAVIELIESSVDYHFCGLLLLDSAQEAELMVSIKYPASEFDLAAFKARTIDTFYQVSGYNILLERIALNRTDGPAILVSEAKKDKDVLNSFHAIGLNMKNKCLGLLAVSHSRTEAFSHKDLKLLSMIADHSILAINNAALHKRIKKLSITDGLTGLYVYRHFQDRLDEEIRRAGRYQEQLSMILMDIDGFKRVNDSFGHLAGDEVLKEISRILLKICREVDVVARYGGDEFAVILPQTGKEGSFYVAERIRKAIKGNNFKSRAPEPINLTVSCGVASFGGSVKERDVLIKKADDALYQAKNEGKNKTALNQV